MRGIALLDMSTIVPIVLALLLFFGSVVSAMRTIDEKNRRIDLVLSLVQVVDRLTEGGVLTEKRFKEVTETLKETLPVQFYVCITSPDDDRYARCDLRASSESRFVHVSPSSLERYLKNKEMVSASFPITFQVEKDGIPFNDVKRILVVVWQGQ